jgi:hypothetical protein
MQPGNLNQQPITTLSGDQHVPEEAKHQADAAF